ncbi:hypothetical protein AB9F26_20730 [Falsihalocynthiibacter sp. BN13B15]|uniref:cupredoxin domain-containing protein n=1 Tax=Falsihalocynthiibacter sp. BN13B15 TaxID=3240871 RepID=UPI00350F1647
MKTISGLAIILATTFSSSAFAEGDLSRADVQKIAMEMGTDDDGNMYFKPDHLEFETGKAYALVTTNVDDYKHELAMHEVSEKFFTRKIEIESPDGELVAEIKGKIEEVEVGPHQTVEWFFVPIQIGADLDMSCEIEGHKEAGMFGTVTRY